MHLGCQLVADEGFLSLEKDRPYYLFSNLSAQTAVRLVFFTGKGAGARANLIEMPRDDFERGLAGGDIRVAGVQLAFPPHLSSLEERLGEILTPRRFARKRTPQQAIAERLAIIRPLVDRFNDIRRAEYPIAFITEYLRKHRPDQCVGRVVYWLLVYELHGKNENVLIPETFNCGRWLRNSEVHAGKKFGRPCERLGRKHGYGVTSEIAEQIVKSFLRHARECCSWKKIYRKAVRLDFGCLTARDETTGLIILAHPQGLPYPSINQFMYWTRKAFDTETIARLKFGDAYVHRRMSPDQGSYSEAVANLMERVEFDGYYLAELPKTLDGTGYMRPLCVIRARCLTSKAIVGIGFAFEKERASAYRACLFSMALDKKAFCALFGISLGEGEWPCMGLPSMSIIDRGPGVSLLQDIEKLNLSVINVTPTGVGQAKASIETSHPKTGRVIEGHEFIESDKNVIELIRQEIERVLIDNNTTNVRHQRSNDMKKAGVGFSPVEIWKYLAANFRTDAEFIEIDTAIRNFLVPTKVTLKQSGVYLGSSRYASTALKETRIFDEVARGESRSIGAYVLEGCVRHIWVEYRNSMFMLDAIPPIRDSEDSLFISYADYEWLEKVDTVKGRDFAEHCLAYGVYRAEIYRQDTGKELDSGRLRKGRPKNSSTAREELQDLKQQSGRGNRE